LKPIKKALGGKASDDRGRGIRLRGRKQNGRGWCKHTRYKELEIAWKIRGEGWSRTGEKSHQNRTGWMRKGRRQRIPPRENQQKNGGTSLKGGLKLSRGGRTRKAKKGWFKTYKKKLLKERVR